MQPVRPFLRAKPMLIEYCCPQYPDRSITEGS
jgi:hypothetical protein